MSKSRTFFYATLFGLILVKLFNVFFNKIVTATLPQNQFSEYLMVINAVVMITGISALGISTSLMRYLVRYDSKKEGKKIKELLSTTLIYINIFQTMIFILLFVVANIGLMLFESSNYNNLLILTMILSYIQLLGGFLNITSYSRSDSKGYFLLTVFPYCLLLIFTIILSLGGSLGVYPLIYSNIVANGVIMPIILFRLIKSSGLGKFSFSQFKDSLKLAGPLVVVGQFETASNYLLLALLYSFYPNEVAIYSIGLSIANLIQLFQKVIPTTYTPLVIRHFDAGNHQFLNHFINRTSKIYFTLAVPLLLTIYAFSPLLIELLSTKEYLLGTIVVFYFSAINLLRTSRYMTSFGHIVKMKTLMIAISGLISIVAKVIFGLLLIPTLGMAGLALTILINTVIAYIGEFIVSQKLYRINYQIKEFIKIFFLSLITFSLAIFLYTNVRISFELSLIISALFFTISAFLSRIVTLDDIHFLEFIFFKRKYENNIFLE